MRRLLAAAVLTVLALTTPTPSTAQVNGVAITDLIQGDVLEGFIGPFRPTATGVDFNYIALCYSTATREKRMTYVLATVPDGSSLAQLRSLVTTAVVDACAVQGITVPRGAVLLPAVQFGQ